MIKSLIVGGTLADVRLFGFDALGKIDFRAELSGESGVLTELALGSDSRPSKYGAQFRFDDSERTAVLVFHNGMLVDVADCNQHSGGETSELKVYSFQGVKLGLLVDDDVDSEILWGRICPMCDGIVAIVRELDLRRTDRIEKLRKVFSVPVAVCHDGDIVPFGTSSPVSVVPASDA